jgi:hypothetical protein
MDANQIYITARAAGFTVYSAVTATAIAFAESGGDPANIGDVSLETATYGPSVGLMQVRSLKSETGTSKSRDANKLTDPMFNMKAAYSISLGGTNWLPWTTYTTTDPKRSYKQYLAQAQGARLASDPIITQKLAMKKDWATIVFEAGINSVVPGAGGAVTAGAGALADAINTSVASPLDAAKSGLALLSKAGAWMGNSHNWGRVALVVAGSAGVLAGLTMLARAGAGPVSSVAGAPAKAVKAAASVVPVGRAAKIVGTAAKAAKATKAVKAVTK